MSWLRRARPANAVADSGRPPRTEVASATGQLIRGHGGPGVRPRIGPLAEVTAFRVGPAVVTKTLATLAQAGREGSEAFVVWGGTVIGDTFEVASAIVPVQTAHTTDRGLLVTVEGAALFEVNRELYRRGELLGAQVHSHPTDAFHSDTDDHYPLATILGSLSVVVPDFARHGLGSLNRWAFYRLAGPDQWAELGNYEHVELTA